MDSETRPWGSFHIIDEGSGFKVKRIEVHPGGQTSLQSHRHRYEHWTIAMGLATVTVDDRVLKLQRGQSIDVPLGSKHRLAALDGEAVMIIEVQFGDHLSEDDIIRHHDVYARS